MKKACTNLLIGFLIVGAAVCGLCFVLRDMGLNDVIGVTRQVLNTDNIIRVQDYAFKSGSIIDGVTVTYDEDGVITLNGQAAADTTICLGKYYILEDSYYTVSVYCDEPARTTSGIQIMYSGDNWGTQKKLASGTFAKDFTFKNDTLQYVKVYLTLSAGDTFENYTVAPVMVEGKTLGTFYAEKTIYI